MASDSFDFKHFSIRQDRCAMKVGTDGVLLGAWSPVDASTHRILDIGTGTGIVALMLAQRLQSIGCECHIDAVEIDSMAAAQARQNVETSPWSQDITVIHSSLADCQAMLSCPNYDLIVSNPPFYNATLKPDDQLRAIARHKDSMPVAQIASFAHSHLTPAGRLALIYPSDYDTEVMTASVLQGFHPAVICDVLTKVGKPCKRRMAVLSLTATDARHEELPIRLADGQYSSEYIRLTTDFYLHLTP